MSDGAVGGVFVVLILLLILFVALQFLLIERVNAELPEDERFEVRLMGPSERFGLNKAMFSYIYRHCRGRLTGRK